MRTHIILALSLVACGCESVLSNPDLEQLACSGVDCGDPDTLADVQTLPERGMVAGQISCNSVAVRPGTPPATARFYYQATRFIDGSCLASATIGSGTDRAVGSSYWRRGAPQASTCLVQAALPAFVPALASVQGGQIRIEVPGCTTAPGTACTLSAALCSGDVAEFQ